MPWLASWHWESPNIRGKDLNATKHSTVLAAVLAMIASVLTALAFAAPAQAKDMNCSDFSSQRAAQTWFLNNGGPRNDPAGLDYDNDGIACESNPCPCMYSTGGTGGGDTSTAPKPTIKTLIQYGRVIKVIDGDTVDVRLHSGAAKRIRMIGIDTPEVYGGTECGGPQASRALKKKLPIGQRVKLVSDPTQDLIDRYDRLLRYVIRVSDSRDMNRAQVAAGWASVYVYNNNPFKRVTSYRDAQRAARATPRGMWKAC